MGNTSAIPRTIILKFVQTHLYCPKFQPTELVCGAGKQRAASLYFPGRNLEQTRMDLRNSFYGCDMDKLRPDWQRGDGAS